MSAFRGRFVCGGGGDGSSNDRLRLHGIPVWWRTRIEEWHPPHRFVDTQIRGPFRRWHHLHEFVETDDGTLVRDTVDFDVYVRLLYRTPLLGWLEADLRRIFEYRQDAIDQVFGDGAGGIGRGRSC